MQRRASSSRDLRRVSGGSTAGSAAGRPPPPAQPPHDAPHSDPSARRQVGYIQFQKTIQFACNQQMLLPSGVQLAVLSAGKNRQLTKAACSQQVGSCTAMHNYHI